MLSFKQVLEHREKLNLQRINVPFVVERMWSFKVEPVDLVKTFEYLATHLKRKLVNDINELVDMNTIYIGTHEIIYCISTKYYNDVVNINKFGKIFIRSHDSLEDTFKWLPQIIGKDGNIITISPQIPDLKVSCDSVTWNLDFNVNLNQEYFTTTGDSTAIISDDNYKIKVNSEGLVQLTNYKFIMPINDFVDLFTNFAIQFAIKPLAE